MLTTVRPAQRSALERPRQQWRAKRPDGASKRDGADRPKQQNVAPRQIMADAPREHAGRENEERPAPGAQHAARLIVDHDEPRRTVKLLNAHHGDKQHSDEHRRGEGVRKLAFKFHGYIVIQRFRADRGQDDDRQIDHQRDRRDSGIGRWATANAGR